MSFYCNWEYITLIAISFFRNFCEQQQSWLKTLPEDGRFLSSKLTNYTTSYLVYSIWIKRKILWNMYSKASIILWKIFEHSFEQNIQLVETKEILRVKDATFRLITYFLSSFFIYWKLKGSHFEQNIHLVETKEILRVKFNATFSLITYLFLNNLLFFHKEIERKQVHIYFVLHVRFIFVERSHRLELLE